MLLPVTEVKPYQHLRKDYILEKRTAGLFLDMGLGKTVITLSAINTLLNYFAVSRVLVIAPLGVCNMVWVKEHLKWEHLQHLKVNIVTGSLSNRKKQLSTYADIYVINRENVKWLCSNYKFSFDMLVVDESTSFKNPSSQRFKFLKQFTKNIPYKVILTGTPSSNSIFDIWSQIYILDSGKRLGKHYGKFLKDYMDHKVYAYSGKIVPRKGAIDEINAKISDICISMRREDYLDLPPVITSDFFVEMPDTLKSKYKELEDTFILDDITAISKAGLMNKLFQFCNGSIYDNDKNIVELHDLKINALKDIIEDNPNENIIVAYQFKHDLVKLQKHFKHAVQLTSKSTKVEDDWNSGKIKLLFVHPHSVGEGLNLQLGGCMIIWYGLTWWFEKYLQLNSRLTRSGQTKPVRIIRIIMKDGIDEMIIDSTDVVKMKTHNEVMDYLKCKILAKR